MIGMHSRGPRAKGKMLRGPCDFREGQGVLPAVLPPLPLPASTFGDGAQGQLAIRGAEREARCEEAGFSPAQPGKMCSTETQRQAGKGILDKELPYHGPRYWHLNKT